VKDSLLIRDIIPVLKSFLFVGLLAAIACSGADVKGAPL